MFGHRIVIFCLLICLFVFGTVPVLGEEPDPGATGETSAISAGENQTSEKAGSDEEAVVPNVSDMLVPSLTRIALSLGVIIFIIYGVVFLLRRLSGNRFGGGRRNKNIQMVEQTFLAPKKSVCLLKMADRAVLVGVTDSQISLLTEMEWDALPQDIRQNAGEKKGGFQGVLNDTVAKLFRGKPKGANGEQII